MAQAPTCPLLGQTRGNRRLVARLGDDGRGAIHVARAGTTLAALLVLAAAGSAHAAAPDFRATYEAAQKLYAEAKYAEALAAYENAFAIDPAVEATYGIARCHHQLGHYAEAAAAYERFLAAAPAHEAAPKVRGHLATALATLGRAKLAAAEVSAARVAFVRGLAVHLADDPAQKDATSAALLAGLGEALLAAGDDAGAAATLRSALAADLATELRARAEEMLKRAEAAVALGPSGAAARAPRKGGAGLWIGIGAGAGAVAIGAAVVLVVLLVVKPGRPDLGWYDYHYDGM
ncbi:MAG TPA: tetratricopeptide repeat protein [Myxococcota bacterium]|nr:tetratricopeptide repeat protein [Myxococcota bacterium]